MNIAEIIKKLREPFPYNDTEWKIQATNKEKTRGLAVVYIDSRAIQKRLDNIVGPMNWQNQYMLWQDKSQICGISIYDESRNIWVTKYDGAENTDYEPIKGGLSDSFKRAAVIWGLGRYLYAIDALWVEIEQRGSSSIIKETEKIKLQNHYNKCIQSIFSPKQMQSSGVMNTMPDTAMVQTSVYQQPVQQQPLQQPVYQQQATQQQVNQQAQPVPNIMTFEYKVQSSAISGNSTCLQLISKDGKQVTVYAKKDSPGLKAGACIKNVVMEKKEANFGAYYMLNQYELTA